MRCGITQGPKFDHCRDRAQKLLSAKTSGSARWDLRSRLVTLFRREEILARRGGGPNVSRREAAHGAAWPPRGHPRGTDLVRTAGTAHAPHGDRQASDFVLGYAIVGDGLAVCARGRPQRTRSRRLRSSRGASTRRPPVDRRSIPSKNWRGPSPRRAQHARGGHGTLISAAGGGQ